MLASSMISKNNKVILVEKNEKLGKKLYITGKGRCNVKYRYLHGKVRHTRISRSGCALSLLHV